MSRILDDVEELLIPATFAIGGLYLLYWVTKSTSQAVGAVPDTVSSLVNYDVPIVGEGDFIDRWTYNPGELKSDLKTIWKGLGKYI
jgi:hypothetical protein